MTPTRPEHLIVSFSGGVDSTAAALVARSTYPDARLDLLYVDLGFGEFPGFMSHVCDAARVVGGALRILTVEPPIIESLADRGWPRFLGPWCQDALNDAMGRWTREHSSADSAWRVIGTRRKQRAAHAKGDRPPLQLKGTREWRTWSPVWAYTDVDVAFTLQSNRCPVWPGYARGFYRTSCAFCPGQRPYCYAALRRHHPGLYDAFSALCVQHGPPPWWYSAAHVGLSLDEMADAGEVEPKHLSSHPATSPQLALLSWGESCAGGGGACGTTDECPK